MAILSWAPRDWPTQHRFWTLGLPAYLHPFCGGVGPAFSIPCAEFFFIDGSAPDRESVLTVWRQPAAGPDGSIPNATDAFFATGRDGTIVLGPMGGPTSWSPAYIESIHRCAGAGRCTGDALDVADWSPPLLLPGRFSSGRVFRDQSRPQASRAQRWLWYGAPDDAGPSSHSTMTDFFGNEVAPPCIRWLVGRCWNNNLHQRKKKIGAGGR